jgi:hypothetical protein
MAKRTRLITIPNYRRRTHEYAWTPTPFSCIDVDKFQAVNARRAPRTRPATSAANPVTFRVNAPTQLARALAVVVVDSLLEVVVVIKSAIRSGFCFETSGIPLTCPLSAQRLATLPETAPRLVVMEAKVVDLAATKVDTVVADTVADVKVDKLATLAAATVTCLVSHWMT